MKKTKVQIKTFGGTLLFEYTSEDNTIRKALIEAVNKGAYLRGADLRGADLRGAYLRGADLQGAYLRGADLQGAYLRGAYLRGADLRGADLRGADLRGAYLRGAKEYYDSHYFWAEIIRIQKLDTFTDKEWSIIGKIITHQPCWDTIKEQYNKKILPIFKKLAKAGFEEYLKHYEEVLKI